MEERKNNVADFLRWVYLKTENEVYPGGTVYDNVAVVFNHVKETWQMLVIWTLLQLAFLIFYIGVASAEANFNQGPVDYSSPYRFVHFVCVTWLLLNILAWTIIGARVGVYSAALALLHKVGLPLVGLIYAFISAILPDVLEDAFDKDRSIKRAIDDARDNDAVHTLAGEIITGYLGSVAWMIFISWLVLVMPVRSFQSPSAVLLSVIAIIFLIYASFGWSRQSYWVEKIQTGAMYLAAAYVIYKMAIAPFLDVTWFTSAGSINFGELNRNVNWLQVFVILGLMLLFLFLLQKIYARFVNAKEPGYSKPGGSGIAAAILPFFVIGVVAMLLFYIIWVVAVGVWTLGSTPTMI